MENFIWVVGAAYLFACALILGYSLLIFAWTLARFDRDRRRHEIRNWRVYAAIAGASTPFVNIILFGIAIVVASIAGLNALEIIRSSSNQKSVSE